MKDKKIYIDNIPKFEEYDLIDLIEDDSLFLMKMYNEENENKISHGTRFPDGIFIIGKKSQDNNICVDAELFFNDYLKLGRDIFNLSTSKNDIEFQYPYKLDDDYLYLKYIADDVDYEIKMCEKYGSYLDEFYTIKEEARAYLEDTIFEEHLGIFQELTDMILNVIYVLYVLFNQEVQEKIEYLIKIMSRISECCISVDTDTPIENFIRLTRINKDLLLLLNDIKEEMKSKNFNIRKKSITSNAKKLDKITNIDFINKINDFPIKIKFTFNQFKDLKKIIKSWLKKYGFPYCVKSDDEEKYKIEIKKIIQLKDDEMAVPCDTLITHSVYNYMLYTIFKNKNKTDEKTKKLFEFNSSKENNKNNVFSKRNYFNYYNNVVCANILGFKSSYDENIKYEKEFLREDNYLYEKNDEYYEDRTFNNLCIAFGIILKKEILYDTPNSNEKQCPICSKCFTPNQSHKVYCSKKCKEVGNRRKNTENHRKNRKLKKSNE